MKPLKGVSLPLNQEVLDWFWEVRKEIDDHWSDEIADDNPMEVIDNLVNFSKWTYENDKFGKKAYRETPCDMGANVVDGVLRVTVVLMKNGVIKLDIRGWGEY